MYLTDYNLLIAQELWQAHYQILLMILLNKFIELNVNTDTIIKNVKLVELNTKHVDKFAISLNFHTVRKTKHLVNACLRNFTNSLMIYMKSK